MVHEYGASSAQFEPERIAAHDRLLAWSSLGRGAIGFLAWCWTDATTEAYREPRTSASRTRRSSA